MQNSQMDFPVFGRMLHRLQYYWEMDDLKQQNRTSIIPSSPTKNGKKKKRVQYSNVCSVVLIPTRQEFKNAGLDLWYKRGEYCYGYDDNEEYMEKDPENRL